MKYPKVREVGEAIKALVRGPYTSRFPREPHVPHVQFRGQPKFNAEACVGCLACEAICPVNAIAHEDRVGNGSSGVRVIIHYTDTCIFCGQCEAACIADGKGITLSHEWDLAFFDRSAANESIEKELQICEVCGATVACRDHLRWLARRLGEMSYANPTLYLARLRDLGLVADMPATPHRDAWRSDRVKILCARCRRRAALETDR